MLVAGVDSSTQSTKVLLCQAGDGAIVGQGTAPHPDGTECDPELWWQALAKAAGGLLGRADAIGVAAQQHGMVVTDEAGQVIRPALLWNDVRSAPQAAALIADMGGPGPWARLAGSVPTAPFPRTQPRWLAQHGPGHRGQDCAGHAPARLADLAARRPGGRARDRPRRRLWYRVLLPRPRALAARPGRGRAGQAGRAAAAGRPGRDRGPDARRHPAVR